MADVNKQIQLNIAIDTASAASSIKEVKTALKDLKSQALQFGEGSEGFEKATKAAGELQKKLEDVNEQLAIDKSEGLNKVGAQLGFIKNKLLDLDFKGVNLGVSNLAKSFLGVEQGAKLSSVSITGIGKALIATGIGAFVVLIGVLIANFSTLKESGGAIGKVFTFIGDKVQALIGFFKRLSDAIGLTTFEANEKAEKAKEQAEAYAKGLEETQKKEKQAQDEKSARDKKAAADEAARIAKTKAEKEAAFKAQVKAQEDLDEIELIQAKDKEQAEIKLLTDKIIRLEAYSKNELRILGITETGKQLEIAKSYAKIDDITQKAVDKQNEIEKKAAEESNKIAEDKAAAALARLEKNFQSAKEVAAKAAEEANLTNQANFEESNKSPFTRWQEGIDNMMNSVSTGLSIASEFANSIGNIMASISATRINRVENESNAAIQALQEQKNQGLITEEQFAAGKDKINKESAKKELELRKKAFKQQKAMGIVNAIIGGAQGVVAALSEPFFPLMIARLAMTVATTAAQIGVIASQKFPEGEAAPSAGSSPSIATPAINEQPAKPNDFALFGTAGSKNNLGFQGTNTTQSNGLLRAYVTESDISSTQDRVKRYKSSSEL